MNRTSSALDDAGHRLQAVLDNASVAIFLMDHRQHCVYMNRAAELLTGFTLDEVLGRDEPLHDIVHHHYPDGRPFPLSECAIDRAFPEHHQVTGEEVFVHKDGSFYPVAFTASPIRDDASKTVGTIIEVRNLTAEKALEAERHEAEQRLRETDRLLRSIGEGSADLIYAKDRDCNLLYANPATLRVIGRPPAEVLGRNELDWHHDRDEAEAINATDRQVMDSGEVLRLEEEFTTPGGSKRFYQSTKAPLWGDDNAVVGIVGVSSDITDRRLAEEQQKLLLHELNHRVKNTLATVQSLAYQSFKIVSPGAMADFEGRLAALSGAHDILTRGLWVSAPIEEVVSAALRPFSLAGRLNARGDPCELEPKAVLTLAMVLHELGTNACKYGALKGDSGTVDVRWSCEPEGEATRLRLRWAEAGGPPVAPPTRRGFGSRLIERQIGREFNGKAELRFEPDGVVAEIEFVVRHAPFATVRPGGQE